MLGTQGQGRPERLQRRSGHQTDRSPRTRRRGWPSPGPGTGDGTPRGNLPFVFRQSLLEPGCAPSASAPLVSPSVRRTCPFGFRPPVTRPAVDATQTRAERTHRSKSLPACEHTRVHGHLRAPRSHILRSQVVQRRLREIQSLLTASGWQSRPFNPSSLDSEPVRFQQDPHIRARPCGHQDFARVAGTEVGLRDGERCQLKGARGRVGQEGLAARQRAKGCPGGLNGHGRQ